MMDKPDTGDKKQRLLTPLSEYLEERWFNNIKDLKGIVLPLNEFNMIEGVNSLPENVDMLTPIKNVMILEPLPAAHSRGSKADIVIKEEEVLE